ncbi:hypothetical protein [Methylobacterium brachythecii]|uniref:Uncharacterized protein n=1 Tax=Methylobacterium brachythecii TaxID=1176177 RepID=A0A7W6AF47_9HYPH|nr:hypothetical protein [Methylobacterium brachythecii]MBB3901573.1 hypothetical protein [Methylobacterium brachythecii]
MALSDKHFPAAGKRPDHMAENQPSQLNHTGKTSLGDRRKTLRPLDYLKYQDISRSRFPVIALPGVDIGT